MRDGTVFDPPRGGTDDRGERAPGGGRPDLEGLRFDRPIVPGGYGWTYFDVLSSDGAYGLVVIALVGNVFSPFYRRARLAGAPDPSAFATMNVALYARGRGGRGRWALTEGGAVVRSRDDLAIGRSSLSVKGSELRAVIDERTALGGRPLWGRVVLRRAGGGFEGSPLVIDANGRHRWRPYAPRAEVEVVFDEPRLRFRGTGYIDGNDGDEGLEDAFRGWSWARLGEESGAVTMLYDVTLRSGEARTLTHRVEGGKVIDGFAPPGLERRSFGRTGWGVPRELRVDRDASIHGVRSLEDAPFYARSELRTRIAGREAHGTHETVDLERFVSPMVQRMIPYRMRRV